MNYLFVVNLNLNNISGEFPPIFTRSPNAIFVDLSDNQFSGNLPLWIWEKMPSIALLRLRSNKFDGSIPNNGLAMCKGLQFLDLAHNKLTGSIPPSLVNLSAVARTSGYSKSLHRSLNIGAAVGYYNAILYMRLQEQYHEVLRDFTNPWAQESLKTGFGIKRYGHLKIDDGAAVHRSTVDRGATRGGGLPDFSPPTRRRDEGSQNLVAGDERAMAEPLVAHVVDGEQ
ncbi:hypothetical protein EJB05_51382, partial [Eragrostis curvula]